jgi:hypothetical protein
MFRAKFIRASCELVDLFVQVHVPLAHVINLGNSWYRSVQKSSTAPTFARRCICSSAVRTIALASRSAVAATTGTCATRIVSGGTIGEHWTSQREKAERGRSQKDGAHFFTSFPAAGTATGSGVRPTTGMRQAYTAATPPDRQEFCPLITTVRTSARRDA